LRAAARGEMVRDMLKKLRGELKNAFDLRSPYGELTEEDLALLEKIALKVVARRMSMPATLFLESVRPLNSVGSQTMVFVRPFVEGWLNIKDYDRLVCILDRREGLHALVEAIEKAEEAHGKDRKK
jgi:hypothetical protein